MTAPLVPPDVEIPRLPWVPIYADRLFESTFFAVATGDEFRAAFCLWLRSWTQHPPGSLPNDDRLLCRLADLNGNLAKWGKVKRMAMRHWILCNDGRFYHPVVAELVLDAANKLTAKQTRMAVARAARRNNKPNDKPNNKANNQAPSPQDSTDTGQNIPSGPERAHAREEGIFMNGGSGAVAMPAPVHPKIKGHALPCDCPNCTRWVEQQRSA